MNEKMCDNEMNIKTYKQNWRKHYKWNDFVDEKLVNEADWLHDKVSEWE